MSSTTERERGQVLAIFALSLLTLILVAALAFDTGMVLLERRDQQNAADAAAIAGARYLPGNTGNKAETAARNIASVNGFTDGAGGVTVEVHIPPTSGPNSGRTGYVEVEIASTRPSIFGGILGIAGWPVGARAVAVNQDGAGTGYSILALEPEECHALDVSGNGEIVAYGNIQVNSTCDNGALRRQGGGTITVDVPSGACSVVGDIDDGGGKGVLNCVPIEGAPEVPDPLATLPEPTQPAIAASAVQVFGTETIPDGCPGSAKPATLANPAVCNFPSNYAGTTWRLYPGLYPGGIKLQGGTFYLEPGIYYIGGGGLDITGTGTSTISVLAGGTTGPEFGVMFFNTELSNSAAGPISLNGGQANIQLYPLMNGSRWDGIVIYQDRDLDINGDDVTINGSTSDMYVRGTIYVAAGDVKVNGSSGTLVMDQIIAGTYKVDGASGSIIKALNDEDFVFKLIAAGLVE